MPLPQRPGFIGTDALEEGLPKHLERLVSLQDILQEPWGTRIFFAGGSQAEAEIRWHFSNSIMVLTNPKTYNIKIFRAEAKD